MARLKYFKQAVVSPKGKIQTIQHFVSDYAPSNGICTVSHVCNWEKDNVFITPWRKLNEGSILKRGDLIVVFQNTKERRILSAIHQCKTCKWFAGGGCTDGKCKHHSPACGQPYNSAVWPHVQDDNYCGDWDNTSFGF